MINKDFFAALADLSRQRGIAEDVFINVLETALSAANKRLDGGSGANVTVQLNPEKCSMRFFLNRTVVDAEEAGDGEITLADAKLKKKSAKVGDVLTEEFTPKEDYSRILAQNAKQIVLQRLHEMERENTISEYSDKEGELMSGLIRKRDAQAVYIELGKETVEGVLMPQDQVPGEHYDVGKRIKVFVKRIKNSGYSAQVVVSRTSPGLVRRLFEEEVPEIKQGLVEIKSVAREPGHRTKIAIYSSDSQVDAIGACVGNKGARVNAIVQELGGEKIDIIPWSENPLEFISKALSPATVDLVTQTGEKTAVAVVPNDKLSLAIGREGQNARLAARLTGWKIDVKSASAAAKLNIGYSKEEGEGEDENV